MDRPFNLSAVGSFASIGGWVVSASQFDNLAGIVFDDFITLEKVCVAKPDFPASRQAEELLGSVFHKIASLDVYLAAERNFPRARIFVFGIVRHRPHLKLTLGIVFDDDFDWINHRIDTR